MTKPDFSQYPIARRRRVYLYIMLVIAGAVSAIAIGTFQTNPRSVLLAGSLVLLEYVGGYVLLITNPIPAIGLVLPAAIITTAASTALLLLIGGFSFGGPLKGSEATMLHATIVAWVSNTILLISAIIYARAVRQWLTPQMFIAGSAVALLVAGVFYHFI